MVLFKLMLLVLNVNNTNTMLGLFRPTHEQPGVAARYDQMVAHWRVATIRSNTADEYGVLFRNLSSMQKIDTAEVKAVVVSSVVPPLDSTLRDAIERYFQTKPLFVEPGVKTGMPVLVDNPAEVGADRIVNGVAAFERYGGPCVVVDIGTAITFDVISERGEYLGGVIAPGVGISAEALFQRTARLPKVDIRRIDACGVCAHWGYAYRVHDRRRNAHRGRGGGSRRGAAGHRRPGRRAATWGSTP